MNGTTSQGEEPPGNPLRQLHATHWASTCESEAVTSSDLQLCSKPTGPRGIGPETFRRRGQLLSRPPTTGQSLSVSTHTCIHTCTHVSAVALTESTCSLSCSHADQTMEMRAMKAMRATRATRAMRAGDAAAMAGKEANNPPLVPRPRSTRRCVVLAATFKLWQESRLHFDPNAHEGIPVKRALEQHRLKHSCSLGPRGCGQPTVFRKAFR